MLLSFFFWSSVSLYELTSAAAATAAAVAASGLATVVPFEGHFPILLLFESNTCRCCLVVAVAASVADDFPPTGALCGAWLVATGFGGSRCPMPHGKPPCVA